MTNKIDVSVIVPTLNRSKMLADLLDSLNKQKPDGLSWEVWVIDNGSTDDTPDVVESKKSGFPVPLRYYYEPNIGLHNVRNNVVFQATGKVIGYLDDDTIASESWIQGCRIILDGKADLVGGRGLPRWEAELPDWIETFYVTVPEGKIHFYLGLIDLGTKTRVTGANNVFGGNCFVRKELIIELKGYHPDSLPQELIRYRGDGETAFSMKFSKRGLKSYYDPVALVYHRINAKRLTVEYVCQNSYNQGISNSFTNIRMKHGLYGRADILKAYRDDLLRPLRLVKRFLFTFVSELRTRPCEIDILKKQLRESYDKGFAFHQKEVRKDPVLREWVLRRDYFAENGRLPEKSSLGEKSIYKEL